MCYAFRICCLQGLSLMPAEFLLLSLPWWLRYKADNMLMSMLIPHTLSAASQLKYFKKVIDAELNDLVCVGIKTWFGNVKVKVFGQVKASYSVLFHLGLPPSSMHCANLFVKHMDEVEDECVIS